MRKLLLLLLLILTLPATAQSLFEDLRISREGDIVNIRVTLKNSTGHTQAGPLKVELYARPMGSEQWSKVHTWTNLPKLAKGNRVSRDFFSNDGDLVSNLAMQDHFEVRAVLTGPGLSEETQRMAEPAPEHEH